MYITQGRIVFCPDKLELSPLRSLCLEFFLGCFLHKGVFDDTRLPYCLFPDYLSIPILVSQNSSFQKNERLPVFKNIKNMSTGHTSSLSLLPPKHPHVVFLKAFFQNTLYGTAPPKASIYGHTQTNPASLTTGTHSGLINHTPANTHLNKLNGTKPRPLHSYFISKS